MGADHADRLVDQIFRHVVAVVVRRIDWVIVDRQLGRELIGRAPHEAVVAIEASL